MKKLIIGSLVGGIFLFIWQFLSWSVLPIHQQEMSYTPNQDVVLKVLSENLKEGEYFLPTLPAGHSAEEAQALQEELMGKPWATVSYHPSYSMNLPANLARGLVIDILSLMLLIWVFSNYQTPKFLNIFLSTLAVGFIGFLSIVYLENIWFETRTLGYLIDTIISWGVIGAWLGFWLPKK